MDDLTLLSDDELMEAYRACEDEPGCQAYDEIVAEIERRNLDI